MRKKELIDQSSTTFELALNGHELWIHVTFENQIVEKFCIQKFNSNYEGNSNLHRFVKEIFNSPLPGDKKIKLVLRVGISL